MKMLAELLSSEGLSLWLVYGHLLPKSSHNVLSSVPVCILIPSYKDTSHMA